MRSLMLALTFFAGLSTDVAEASDAMFTSPLHVGNWNGGSVATDGKFSHCSMLAVYQQANLMFQIYPNGSWSVNLNKDSFTFTPGISNTIQVSVDGSDPVPIKGVATSKTNLMFLIDGNESIEQFRRAARLRFFLEGAKSIAFDLTDFAAATDALVHCYRAGVGLENSPVTAKEIAPHAPSPTVAAAQPLPPRQPSKGRPASQPGAGSDDLGRSGSGVLINTGGDVLTNFHVVKNCSKLSLGVNSKAMIPARLIATDERNDLAVVRFPTNGNVPFDLSSPISFRDGKGMRAGEDVVVLGFPYNGLLASEANVGRGAVTALSGLMDDTRFLQISAPIQPGNSGGPLLDMSGHLGGINTSTLDALVMVKATGSIPQNVNFSIKASIARDFLDAKGLAYEARASEKVLSPEDVSEIGQKATLLIQCTGSS